MLGTQRLLKSVVCPVMGCTEPAAVALACSMAAEVAAGLYPPPGDRRKSGKRRPESRTLPGEGSFNLELLRVRTSRSIFKNAMAVGIPPSGRASGIHIAAAMGAFLPAREGLNLLKSADEAVVEAGKEIMRHGRLVLEVDERDEEIYIEAIVIGTAGGDRHVGEAVISGGHSAVALLRRDGRTLMKKGAGGRPGRDPSADLQHLSRCRLGEIIAMARNLRAADIDYLIEGVGMNRRAAEKGIALRLGLGVGAALRDMVGEGQMSDDIVSRIKIATAGAADARMSGYEVEVMSSSGSGNQGIMAILPVAIVAEGIGADRRRLAQALALSHLITAHMTAGIGLLSALCGCVVKAGIGATAGIAWLLSGKEDVIEAAIGNMAGNIVGEICDGAKVGCALKMATASSAAVDSACLACRGIRVPWTNGIVGASSAETFGNISQVSAAMKEADRVIIEIIGRKRGA
jgi:L-cysteine desulfidase